MKHKLFCSLQPLHRTNLAGSLGLAFLAAAAFAMGWVRPAFAGDPPQWMRAGVTAPLPAHDGKTDAVSLSAEPSSTARSTAKFSETVRDAHTILGPADRDH